MSNRKLVATELWLTEKKWTCRWRERDENLLVQIFASQTFGFQLWALTLSNVNIVLKDKKGDTTWKLKALTCCYEEEKEKIKIYKNSLHKLFLLNRSFRSFRSCCVVGCYRWRRCGSIGHSGAVVEITFQRLQLLLLLEL